MRARATLNLFLALAHLRVRAPNDNTEIFGVVTYLHWLESVDMGADPFRKLGLVMFHHWVQWHLW